MSNLKPLNALTVSDWREAELYYPHVSLKHQFWGFGCCLEDAEGKKHRQYEISAKLIARLETDSEIPKGYVGECGNSRVVYAREPEIILETEYIALFTWLEGGVCESVWIPNKNGKAFFAQGNEAYEAIYEHAQNQIGQNGSNEE